MTTTARHACRHVHQLSWSKTFAPVRPSLYGAGKTVRIETSEAEYTGRSILQIAEVCDPFKSLL